MEKMIDQDALEELKKFATPTIANIVATYPNHPLCLGLFDPWNDNWYTDQSVRCMYPELGRTVGYAVTCIYGMVESATQQLTFADVAEALEASPKPSVLLIQQNFPPELANKVGLSGGIMTSAMKTLGCVGAISNGPSRDIDEIRTMNFQYMLSGITPGHGEMAVHAVNVEVTIAGMDAGPGDIIHMDENGACKFPASRLHDVLVNSKQLQREEEERMTRLKSATTAKQVRHILEDLPYSNKRRP